MKVNKEQKDLLIGILEHTSLKLDDQQGREFGENVQHLINEANKLEEEE